MNQTINGKRSEQGAALVMAIITLFIITGLATAMLASARTEMMIATNEERAVHARMAAEAGLNLGVQAAADYLIDWRNSFASAELAVSSLVDDGSLVVVGLAAPTTKTDLSVAEGTKYSVRVYDDDDTAAARILSPLSSGDLTRLGENGTVTSDANKRLVVHATGYGPGATTTVLEAVLGPVKLPAVVTNANLTVHGSVNVEGALGSVHTNSNLTISGGGGTIEDNCTASGGISGPDICGGTYDQFRPTLSVPDIHAINYIGDAGYRLNSDGTIDKRSTTSPFPFVSHCTTPACAAAMGWSFNTTDGGTWVISGEPTWGAYYVEGNVKSSGNPGTPTPAHITLLAEGYIDISGSPDFQPFLTELFIVTDKDLDMHGNIGTRYVEGQVFVREQLNISGSAEFAGQILVQDATNLCPLVTANRIDGNVHIEYDGIAGASNFQVLSWREVR